MTSVRAVFAFVILLLSACGTTPDYHLVHPREIPRGVITWVEDHEVGKLQLHLEGARPAGEGPFPAVLVHPHGGKTTREMQGVIWDLAGHGYLALAADYKRNIDGEYVRNTFAWRSKDDIRASLNILLRNPYVDQHRVAALGFSQGAMLSLLLAAHAGPQLRTVIAYYPVADFNAWFDREKRNFIETTVYWFMRRHFRAESQAASDAEFREMLRQSSPMTWVTEMHIPILLIHGEDDMAAPVEESRKLAAAIRAAGGTVELEVFPQGEHIFNWRQKKLASRAWKLTLDWLETHL